MDASRSQQLVEAARGGDMNAFLELFEEARKTVYAVACRLVGPSDAEDVVMDTYLKAWKSMPGFAGRSAPRTWLCRIARNCAIDRIRARRIWVEPAPEREDGTAGATVADMADPRQRTPAELVAGAELAGEIKAAMDRLSPEHRIALTLRFSDGLSYGEIAAATGVSMGTVMSRLFNGRRKLMKIMNESEGGRP